MTPIFLFDLRSSGTPIFYVGLFLLMGAGIFAGHQFNLTVGEGVFLNSAYTVGFLMGFLSLSLVFIATVLAGQILFRERDARFDSIVFSMPIKEGSFILGRFLSFFSLTFLCFLGVAIGFVLGQSLRTGTEMTLDFHLSYYLYPFLVLGVVNCLMVCGILFFLGTFTRNKMAVIIGGLLLYVLYMVMLVYSGSPFMVGALPQSNTAQTISALADPFGLSAYFFQAKDFTVAERNLNLVPLSGVFLTNRLAVLFFSLLLMVISVRFFSYRVGKNSLGKSKDTRTFQETGFNVTTTGPIVVHQNYGKLNGIYSVLSFVKVDLTYMLKGIAFYAICLLLLFYVGMEIYAAIDQGIRFPQHYASSGLMAQTINRNFYPIGVFLSVYLVNDLYWRSHTSNFSQVESATYFSTVKTISHWLGISAILLIFSLLLILEGIVFQWMFNYTYIDVPAYWGVLVFNLFPLVLLSGFLVLLNGWIRKKYLALAVSVVFAAIVATPLSKILIGFSLFRFMTGYNGTYSDFVGYGIYMDSFVYRLLFGLGILMLIWLIFDHLKNRKISVPQILMAVFALGLVFYGGTNFQRGYLSEGEEARFQKSAAYEKAYRKYQNIPQPTVIKVKTNIDLYPYEKAYTISGTYALKNLTGESMDSILFNFDEALQLERAVFTINNQPVELKDHIETVILDTPLAPGDEASLDFSLRYQWYPVNGHNPVNAIIGNGSFMRISRYFPQIGYQSSYEIPDDEKDKRMEFELGKATGYRKLEATKTHPQDFIDLDMTISTAFGQTAIGTGELLKQWTQGNRHYFHYKAENIPFRFAVSSAKYAVQKTVHRNTEIQVFYHPTHSENVERLIENAKQSLDYCVTNFGAYPFSSIAFAEVSSFTAGFNATAYPSVIFMTENMAFHTNREADNEQDVINELAAHELSHFWWGNNQISPDDREGAAMLTETLAMYTEMMLCKQKYGEEEMEKRLRIHEQIYQSEKGFHEEQALYKVTPENTHISYSKGAMAMVKLSKEIGEKRLNTILKTFIDEYKYPKRATTLDFLATLKRELTIDEYKRMEGLFTQ